MNRDIVLSKKEKVKFETIKAVAEKRLDKSFAAVKLGLSPRHIYRLINNFNESGIAAFCHKNKGRIPVNKISSEVEEKICTTYLTKYFDSENNIAFGFKHFLEFARKNEPDRQIFFISRPTLSKMLFKRSVISPFSHKSTILKLKSLLKGKQIYDSPEIFCPDAHPRKERCKYKGEQIEMDASSARWFGCVKSNLHLAIDNSTGLIVGGCFDWEETLNGYYNVMHQILTNYGIPAKLLTDRRTCFIYNSSGNKTESKDVLTQFGYACKTLGTDIRCTSVPQAKGKIERLNGSVQRRLANELHIKKIDSIEKANDYLINTFIPEYNRQFAVNGDMPNGFCQLSKEDNINDILSVIAKRKIDAGCAISYNNDYYIPAIDNVKKYFKKGTEVLVINTFDKRLKASIDNKTYDLIKIDTHKKYSPEFDNIQTEEIKSATSKTAPQASIFWQIETFNEFLAAKQRL